MKKRLKFKKKVTIDFEAYKLIIRKDTIVETDDDVPAYGKYFVNLELGEYYDNEYTLIKLKDVDEDDENYIDEYSLLMLYINEDDVDVLDEEPEVKNLAWMVMFINFIDSDFGYHYGPVLLEGNLTKAVAKSIARHMNKVTPDFVCYYAEPEPERMW